MTNLFFVCFLLLFSYNKIRFLSIIILNRDLSISLVKYLIRDYLFVCLFIYLFIPRSPVEPSSAAAFHLYNFCNKYDKPWCDTVNRTEDRQLLQYEMALSLNVEKAREDIQKLSNKTKNTLHN